MFINIHTHHSASNKIKLEIQNVRSNFSSVDEFRYSSIGIHPCYINASTWRDEMQQVENFSANNAVLAIGEVGLDKICAIDFSLQKEVFVAHIILANKLNKPLIIHCVRAFDEVHKLLIDNNNQVPVIFHGFNKNEILARQLINKGYFLSFGKSILGSAKEEVLRSVKLEYLFLETDDSTFSIEEIYHTAAAILKIDVKMLELQIQENAQQIFGDRFIKL